MYRAIYISLADLKLEKNRLLIEMHVEASLIMVQKMLEITGRNTMADDSAYDYAQAWRFAKKC